MDSLLLSSDGFEIGRFVLPAFQLRVGECVCLHLPEEITSSEVEALIGVLTGKTSLVAVRLFATIRWAAPLRNRRHGSMGFFRSRRVADWLQRVARASPTQAKAVLQRLSPEEREHRIEQLPGTSKRLLSVEAAWLARAQVVVFTTAGLDPLGRDAVYQAVSSRFLHSSAIHLSFPYSHDGRLQRDCFPGTTCLEMREIKDSVDSSSLGTRKRHCSNG